MTDQADMEAREILGAVAMWDGDTFSHYHTREELDAAIAAVRPIIEAAAYARAAEVAREQTRLNAKARRDRADDELAFEFEGLGNVIATAIEALGEAKG